MMDSKQGHSQSGEQPIHPDQSSQLLPAPKTGYQPPTHADQPTVETTDLRQNASPPTHVPPFIILPSKPRSHNGHTPQSQPEQTQARHQDIKHREHAAPRHTPNAAQRPDHN